jgi:pimeloyl-ACP methyl ester carboxylesterase
VFGMTNRLADATSPYLLQHADNPVDWWPWGAEAFEEARRRNVPVLLSVGYAACHWCHVMAHESFEDEGVARLINDFPAALDLTDVTLVGNDTGGALAQFVIDADDSRIGRLILTNCDGFDQFPPAPFGLIVAAGSRPSRLRVLAHSVRPKALRHSVLGFGGLVRDPLDPELTRRWITPLLTDAAIRRNTANLLRRMDPKHLLDVSTRLSRFTKQVRLIWGTADPFFKIGLARRLRDAFPDATLVEIPTGRTFLPLDEPQSVADEIQAVSARR